MQLTVLTANADNFLSIWEDITDKGKATAGAKGHLYSVATSDTETAKLMLTSVVNLPDCEVTLRT